jgi:hypothetical protein
MSWFDSFSVMNTRSKSPTETQMTERSKSVAEIIGDIESYNEKKRQKEKEDERLVAERLLKLMELSEAPEAKTKPLAAAKGGEGAATVQVADLTVQHDEEKGAQPTDVGDAQDKMENDTQPADVGDAQDRVEKGAQPTDINNAQDKVEKGVQPTDKGSELESEEKDINQTTAFVSAPHEEGKDTKTTDEGKAQEAKDETSPETTEDQTADYAEMTVVETGNEAIQAQTASSTEESEQANEIHIQPATAVQGEIEGDQPPSTEHSSASTVQETEDDLALTPLAQQDDNAQVPEEPNGPAGSTTDAAMQLRPESTLVEAIMKLDSIMNSLNV